MGMQFHYGNYFHAEGEVSVSHQVTSEDDERGMPKLVRETLLVSGKIHGTNPADLTNRISTMRSAYSVHGRDAGLLYNGVPTTHYIRSAPSVRGVRVIKPPTFPDSLGAEYTTYRTYEIELEAEYYVSVAAEIISFQETVSVVGSGGPKTKMIEVADGPPVKQIVRPYSIVRATQTGSAVGRTTYPAAPEPIFPGDVLEDQTRISRLSPKTSGAGGYSEYGTQWSYQFEANRSLSGSPNIG